MDDFQQENGTVDASLDDQHEFDRDVRRWPNNSFENAYMKNGSQENNQESYNTYDVRDNAESQDMFNTGNATDQIGDNSNTYLQDSNVDGIYEIGRDYLHVEQEIQQKHNDIRLLKENGRLLKAEIEEKQRLLETSKVELLTEQDNYDDILKKLNDEIALITAIGLQQEALNNLAKNLFKQKLTVEQLLESFNNEFYQVKIDGNKTLDIFNKKIIELKKELEDISNLKKDTDEKRTAYFNERLCILEKITVKIKELEVMQEKLKVKYYQKIAILDYLKIKANEELSKCADFESELKRMEENECQQINIEENAYFSLQEKEKSIGNELCDIRQKNATDRARVEDLMGMKNDLHEQIGKLLQEESTHLQSIELNNKSLLALTAENNHLTETLQSKKLINEENFKLNEFLKILESDENDTLNKEDETDNLIVAASKRCADLHDDLTKARNDQLLIIDNKNNFDSKKLALLQQLEQLKIEHSKNITDLENQKSLFNTEQEMLVSKVDEFKHEIKSHANVIASQSMEALRIKEQLQENSEKVVTLQNTIKELNNAITAKQNQYEVDLSVLERSIHEKEKDLADAETEIKRRLEIQSEIECLKGEIKVIECQNRDELKTLQENFESESQTKQKILENKKNELETTYAEKKKKVADLQEDIVDEQKNELYLVKTIQKLTFISDKNKRELVTLKNVVKTLDEKLSTIAQTVANSMKDKESIIQSQSTVISTGMAPPISRKKTVKRLANDDDSSSSGVSMNDNDTAWKKKLIMKQYRKQSNTQTITPSMSSQTPVIEEKPATPAIQKGETKKVLQSEFQNKLIDKPTPKITTKVPTKKQKK